MRSRLVILSVLVIALGPSPASAQIVREDDTNSIAGVLVSMPGQPPPVAQWSFRTRAGAILFASLDADVYVPGSRHSETEVFATAEGDTGGGCEGEGGPGLFYLAVIGPDGAEICRAERPAPPPGWRRDPRMACVLPADSHDRKTTYTLRVGLLGRHHETSEVPATQAYPFLLNVSLRGIAPEGIHLHEAVGYSRNRF